MEEASKPVTPNVRQVAVARKYVEGLEADRKRLNEAEQTLQRTMWEAIQLANYNRSLNIAIHLLLRAMESGRLSDDELARIEDLVSDNEKLVGDVWGCLCGHSKYDHDEKGCLYLGCKPICGES